MRLSHVTGLQSHYQLKGLWKSNTEEMFEMRFAEKEWGWTLCDGEVAVSGRATSDDSQLCRRLKKFFQTCLFERGWVLEKEASLGDDGCGSKQCYLCCFQKVCRRNGVLAQTCKNRVILFAEVIPIKSVLELFNKIKY